MSVTKNKDENIPNWENRTLFHGENLRILRAMNSNCVDLIYLDPPFNKGRDFHSKPDSLAAGAKFQDRWSWDDVHEEWEDQIKDEHPELYSAIELVRVSHSEGMAAFMCFMAVRLMAMWRILKPTGSIYLHCDPTASHYLKVIMDVIFKPKNFRNEIIWQRNDDRAKGSQHAPKKWGANTDTILFYTKSDDYFIRPFRKLSVKEVHEKFDKVDENGKRYYTGIPIFCSNSMTARPKLCYEWRGFRNPHPSGWRLSKERLEEEYQKGNVVIKPNGKLERRKYAHDYKGKPLDNNWADVPRVTNPMYPTQKPLALLKRIIKASSNKEDMVLDPFAGCATTCVAAELEGRKWVGIDIWDRAHKVVVQRLQDTTRMLGKVLYETDPPKRDDGGGVSIAPLEVREKYQYQKESWEKLTHEKIKKHLIEAQGDNGLVVCAGCGRCLEEEFMELDHINPRASNGTNDISNRILLCTWCNKTKKHRLTLAGLRDANKKTGWMKDEQRAKLAQRSAKQKYEQVRAQS